MEDEEDISNSFEQSLVQVAMLYDEPTESSEDSFSSSVDENILEEVASIFDDTHTKSFDLIDSEIFADDLFEDEILTEAAKHYDEPYMEVKDARLTEMYKRKQRLENQMMKEAMWESKKVVNSILKTIFNEVEFRTNYKLQYKQVAMKCAMAEEERLTKLKRQESKTNNEQSWTGRWQPRKINMNLAGVDVVENISLKHSIMEEIASDNKCKSQEMISLTTNYRCNSQELISEENLLMELMDLDEDPFNFKLIDKAESSENECESDFMSSYKLQYKQLATECSRAGEGRLAKLKRLGLKSRKEQSGIERRQSGQSDMYPVASGESDQDTDNPKHALDDYMTILKRYVIEERKVRILLYNNIINLVIKYFQVISYKCLSKLIGCHVNVAKQMLFNFVKLHTDARMVTTFLVSGMTGILDGTEMMKVKIILDKEFESISAEFCELKSVHIYSIQINPIVNMDLIQNMMKGNSLNDRLEMIPNLSVVNKTAVIGKDMEHYRPYLEASGDSQRSKFKDVPIKRSYQASITNYTSDATNPKKVKIDDPVQSVLLVDKYRPTSSNSIIGQQGEKSTVSKLRKWLKDWDKNQKFKCALLSGPPGVGKTTTAFLVSKELGFDVVEMNASDTRSKKMLAKSVFDILNTTSLTLMTRVLLMDEVDGMVGNEDRGGIAELIKMIKSSKVPVICICNDRNHQKIRSLGNHCFDLRLSRPRVEQIKAAMMSICIKEKIQIMPDALSELIVGCDQDMRQVLYHLSMVKAAGGGADGGKMEAAQAKMEAQMSKKTSVKMGPWDVCKKVFNKEDHKTMSFNDKSDLYFYDYSLAGMFVQENYLQAKPAAAGGDKEKLMELVSKAADSMAMGDLVEKGLMSGMNWGLLPTAAVFCSVVPGEYMSGLSQYSISSSVKCCSL